MNTFFWIKRIYISAGEPLERLLAGDGVDYEEHRIGTAFSTFENAKEALTYYVENFMDEYDDETEEDDDEEDEKVCTLGFHIIESVMDGRKDLPYSGDLHVWSFDRHGKPLADAKIDSKYDERPFRGRPASERPFEAGDIVVSKWIGEVQVGKVNGAPRTPEYIKEYEESFGETMRLDDTDDCYCVFFDDEYDHAHPSATGVFPLPFPIEKLKVYDKLKAIKITND